MNIKKMYQIIKIIQTECFAFSMDWQHKVSLLSYTLTLKRTNNEVKNKM